MDEELIKIKYRNLLNKLYRIKSKYKELENTYDDLNSCIKENLVVDDKNIVENNFSFIKNTSNALKDELVNKIVKIWLN